MNNQIANPDLAGEKYWTSVWKDSELPESIQIDDNEKGINYEMHRFFSDSLSQKREPAKRLIEVGCARSQWLGYFARYHKLEVDGLDYSPVGCDMSRAMMQRDEVKGEVFCADVFSLPNSLLGRYDVVVTFGVVEHFRNTQEFIGRLASLLAPGGMIITVIPALHGLAGLIQKRLDRKIYDLHVPLKSEMLSSAHEGNDIRPVLLRSAGFLNAGVFNVNSLRPYSPNWFFRKTIMRGLVIMARCVLIIKRVPRNGSSREYLSSHILYSGVRSDGGL